MAALGMIETFQPQRPLTLKARVGLALEILRDYLSVRRLLRRTDLPAVLAEIRSTVEPGNAERGDARYAAYRLGGIVEATLHRLPDARCLIRSLVLVKVLARRGVASTLVIGVAPAPKFRAHAWVEHDGVALLPAYESEYTRLTEL